MALWCLLFASVNLFASCVLPSLVGVDLSGLSAVGHAVNYFICDAVNLGLTAALLTSALRPHLRWHAPLFALRPAASIVLPVLLACLTFPVIEMLFESSQVWFHALLPAADPLSERLEDALGDGDFATNAIYFAVVAVSTPLWEEAIFRGFLLTSLNRFLPTRFAVGVSALVFAAAHFSVANVTYLVALGVIIGYVFVATRNLAAPVLVHAAWNAYVYTKIAFLNCKATAATAAAQAAALPV